MAKKLRVIGKAPTKGGTSGNKSFKVVGEVPRNQVAGIPIQTKSNFRERVAHGINRARKLEKQRPDLLSIGREMMDRDLSSPREGIIKRAADIVRHNTIERPLGALTAFGGLFQRGIGAITNPIIRGQRGEFDEGLPSVARGIAGEELGELGDVIRQIGAPELAAQVGGLVGESFIDPFTRGVGKGTRLATLKTAKETGKVLKPGESTLFATARILQDKPTPVIKDALETGFDFVDPPFAKNPQFSRKASVTASGRRILSSQEELAKDYVKQTEKFVHRPASIAFDDAIDSIKNVNIPANVTDDLVSSLIKLSDDVAGEHHIVNAIRKIKKASRTRRKAGSKFVKVKKPINAHKLRNIMLSLKKTADRSFGDAEAVRQMTSVLEDQFPLLAEANRKWARWTNTLAQRNMILGELPEKALAQTKLIPQQADNLLNFYRSSQVSGGLAEIQRLLDAISGGKAKNLFQKARRVGLAAEFGKARPSLLPIAVGSAAGIGTGAIIDPRLARLGVGGAVLAASEKFLAGTGRLANVGPKRLRALLSTPLGRTVLRIADQGIGRQVTGRDQ